LEEMVAGSSQPINPFPREGEWTARARRRGRSGKRMIRRQDGMGAQEDILKNTRPDIFT
jgi:hypothetical protein